MTEAEASGAGANEIEPVVPFDDLWYSDLMNSFPADWLLSSDSPLLDLVQDIESSLERWGSGPSAVTPVLVWDGQEPLPREYERSSEGADSRPIVLLGTGPFDRLDRPASLHLVDPSPETLWIAIVALSQGVQLVVPADRSVHDSSITGDRKDAAEGRPVHRTITVREQQVLELIARGLPNKAIAAELDISLGTVKFHLSNLMVRLSVQNRAELVMEATREGYLVV